MVNIGMRLPWLGFIVLFSCLVLVQDVNQFDLKQAMPISSEQQNAGPLQAADPKPSSAPSSATQGSGPHHANGPLQNSGPLQPAAPIQTTAPMPDMKPYTESGPPAGYVAGPSYYPVAPDDAFIKSVEEILASLRTESGEFAPTSDQIQIVVDRGPRNPPVYPPDPNPPIPPGQLPPVFYDPGNPSQQSPR